MLMNVRLHENGGCQQTCTNNNGSFLCFCGAGYTLADDDFGCGGKYCVHIIFLLTMLICFVFKMGMSVLMAMY